MHQLFVWAFFPSNGNRTSINSSFCVLQKLQPKKAVAYFPLYKWPYCLLFPFLYYYHLYFLIYPSSQPDQSSDEVVCFCDSCTLQKWREHGKRHILHCLFHFRVAVGLLWNLWETSRKSCLPFNQVLWRRCSSSTAGHFPTTALQFSGPWKWDIQCDWKMSMCIN